MPKNFASVILVAVTVLVAVQLANAQMKSVIPAYIYPGTAWNVFMTSASAAKTHSIIVNPNNGPGTAVDSNYKTYITKAQAAGLKVLGYVATTWGARSSSTVKAEIDRWYSWYNIDGIFFDEGAVASAQVSYYQSLCDYVRSKSSSKRFTMINPGAYYQTSAYINLADSHMVWENAYSAYTSFSMPSWVNSFPASKFCHVVHSTPSGSMANAINLAKQRNVGYLFVTDDLMPNPYDAMPSYWSSFLSALPSSGGGGTVTPTPAPTPTPTPKPSPTPTPNPTPAPSGGSSSAMKSVIPAYIYPGTAWNSFMTSASAAKTHSIIVNPNNGPGTAVDSNYKTYIAKAQAAGVKVLGYVATTWGARASSTVKAEIDKWYSWYKVDGIFFDEGAVTSNKVSYYQSLTNYVKSKSSKNFVMLNPGMYYQTSAYVPVADSHMVWENAYSAYSSFSMPSWVRNYPASKFCHVVHSTPSSKMTSAISLAKQRNVGYLFVTDDVMVNPYDKMPSYWNTFVSALK